MELARETEELLRYAAAYAKDRRCEYITPELMLLVLCGNGAFRSAFGACGGDAGRLESDLEAYIGEYTVTDDAGEPVLSAGGSHVLAFAQACAASSGRNEVGTAHIVRAVWEQKDSYAVYFMRSQGVGMAELLREMAAGNEEGTEGAYAAAGTEEAPDTENGSSGWRAYAPCLNETLEGTNPLIGREAELERTMQILCRKDKNNPLHIGEPGVGKTAITYGLVRKIVDGDVPGPLSGSRVFALDLGGMVAGTRYRGDFEKRFRTVMDGIAREERPIVYIDEIHGLSGTGAAGESAFDASNLLKPYLNGGRIRFIGATTFDEYRKHFEKDRGLARRFQNIEIREPTEEETAGILKGLKKGYEEFHGVAYKRGVPEYIAEMSAKHMHERFLPDKAIDLMDEAGAYRKLYPLPKKKQTVDRKLVAEILARICRMPVPVAEEDSAERLATLEERLKARVFGQDEAVAQAANAIKFSRAGLTEEDKPLASLLFAGPTGVGKTEIARSLAEELGVRLIRFDMGEYEEKHAVAKLIGAPAGYVGYEDGGLLTEEVRKHPSAVLLLDEIEKAHADIYNVLLSVMDYATLTDSRGRKADFRGIIIIMTSNAGANRIGKKGIGFTSAEQDGEAVMEAVERTFQPEFRNRLHRIVTFNGMDGRMADRIVEKKISELGARLEKKRIALDADRKAMELVKRRGISREFGAREVDRVIRNGIQPLLVDDILFGKLKNGGRVSLTAKDGEFAISVMEGAD